ncbi:hypothetical protein MKX01_002283 [Papaver californicum]|nr:hypothetical protein MKX01_002283 [Papaver californicum]
MHFAQFFVFLVNLNLKQRYIIKIYGIIFAGELGKRLALSLSLGYFGFALSGLIIFIKIRKKTNKEEEENLLKIEEFLENYNALQPTRYSQAEMKKITNKFKTELGQGGYGSVFEGKLGNGIQVAVKILANSEGDNNGEEFVNEVGTIVDGSMRLIYEFMPNNSLDKFIFSSGRDNTLINLGWGKLQEIAIGIARGVEYLPKASEYLIRPQLYPKISDFGLAKLCTKGDSFIAVSMATARGTMGYIAPEVFSGNFGTISYKSDVYSFGILLLEMTVGKKNTGINMETCRDENYFPEWVDNLLNCGDGFGTLVALWCIQWNPVGRPSMNAVLHMLEGNAENLPIPPNPFASTSATTTIPSSTCFSLKKLS